MWGRKDGRYRCTNTILKHSISNVINSPLPIGKQLGIWAFSESQSAGILQITLPESHSPKDMVPLTWAEEFSRALLFVLTKLVPILVFSDM